MKRQIRYTKPKFTYSTFNISINIQFNSIQFNSIQFNFNSPSDILQ